MAENAKIGYWKECIGQAAGECGLTMTDEQLMCLAQSAKDGHECYETGFHSPQYDRTPDVGQELKSKYKMLERKFEDYKISAEAEVRRALRLGGGTGISISSSGKIERYSKGC
jgi:hypothetical protein